MDAALSSPAGGMMRPHCIWLVQGRISAYDSPGIHVALNVIIGRSSKVPGLEQIQGHFTTH